MKTYNRILFLLIFISISSIYIFSNNHYNQRSGINLLFKKNVIDFIEYLDIFNNKIKNGSESELIEAYKVLRNKFKKIQFISEHLDPEIYKLELNGAPLPKIDPFDAQILEKEPSGLQVIDELISEDKHNNIEIEKIFIKFSKEIKKVLKIQLQIPINDRLIFESIRQDIVRIMSLSITGFESPSFLNGIEDSKISLETHLDFLKYYKTKIDCKNKEKYNELISSYKSAIDFLNSNSDFESFDRFTFISNHLRQLYSITYEIHLLLEIETYDEVNNIPSKWNYNNEELFSENIYNLNSFTYLNKQNESINKIELGKTLFFDPILSGNSERACASCHNPQKAFTDGLPKSIAINFEGTLQRNSPTLVNSIISNGYFYDLRANLIESQIEHVILNDKEFNTTNDEIKRKLNLSSEYKDLFQKAFPEIKNKDKINITNIGIAISSFIKSLTSFNSNFDRAIRNKAKIDKNVINGFNLFMGKALCGTCHFAPSFNGTVPPYFSDTETEVLGVPKLNDKDEYELDDDLGRYLGKLKQRAEFFKYSFKTLTIRNIELTAPYMHNGVFKRLEEVMDFYNKGGGVGLGFNLENQTLPFDSLSLSNDEINNIILFMNSLTDTTNMTAALDKLPYVNEKYSNRKIGGIY